MAELYIKGIKLDDTFNCGQCFRWNKQEDGSYLGVAGDKPAKVSQEGDCVCIDSPVDNLDFWREYFDADRDYSVIGAQILNSLPPETDIYDVFKKAIEFGGGIRILKQDLWETLCSFIISQNNNIPRIKGIIDRLCRQFGGEIGFGESVCYSFPPPEKIFDVDLSEIRSGFREKYIKNAAVNAMDGILESADSLPSQQARELLKKINGVGDKVADCVLLFAYHRLEIFPQDVWIKRAVSDLGVQHGAFGEYAGIAQQYLFHYYRNGRGDKIGVKNEKDNLLQVCAV
ncbi:MAG: DNA-3-methyladenine glycosylase 2 family protein [Clostridiales bacterium]|jgi:N-glycosylase/DNA lyase|nr:DNA-3-methyladenine glycosylase 2 family protein [Clostridiales bacterium]